MTRQSSYTGASELQSQENRQGRQERQAEKR